MKVLHESFYTKVIWFYVRIVVTVREIQVYRFTELSFYIKNIYMKIYGKKILSHIKGMERKIHLI